MNVKHISILAIISIALLIICPVQAFNVNQLTYSVAEDGSAIVTANYEMSFLEKIGLAVPTVKDEVINAVKTEYGSTAEVVSISETDAELAIPNFADKYDTYMQTPCLNFTKIQSRMNAYWFIGVLDIDYSPTTTTVKFYNGQEYNYDNQVFIPSITQNI